MANHYWLIMWCGGILKVDAGVAILF
jgi:hypothetical protein